ANQLKSALIPNLVSGVPQGLFYNYDSAGNRTQEQIDASINSSAYNSTNEDVGLTAGGSMEFEGSISEPATVTVGGNAATISATNTWMGAALVALGTNLIPIVATDAQGNTTTR